MKNKKNIMVIGGIILLVVVATLLLSIFFSTAFIPSCILMSSLFLFFMCYNLKDSNKSLMYLLFTIGVILVFVALWYTIKRLI